MSFAHPERTSNFAEMIKAEQEALTRSWVHVDSIPTLSEKHRALVDAFGAVWFVGGNFKYEKAIGAFPILDEFITLCHRLGYPAKYMKRASKKGPARILHVIACRPDPTFDWGSYWPKDRKDLPAGAASYAEARAGFRCQVRDDERSKLTPELQGLRELRANNDEQRIQIDHLKSELQEVRADAARHEAELVDAVDEMLAGMRAEIASLRAEREMPFNMSDVDHLFRGMIQ